MAVAARLLRQAVLRPSRTRPADSPYPKTLLWIARNGSIKTGTRAGSETGFARHRDGSASSSFQVISNGRSPGGAGSAGS